MNFESLKTQTMTMISMGNNNHTVIYNMIYTFLLVTFMEHFFSALKILFDTLNKKTMSYLNTQKQKIETKLVTTGALEEKKASIIMFRNFENQSPNDTVDSILEYMSNINNSKSLVFRETYIINNRSELEIHPHIFFQLLSLNEDGDKKIKNIEFELFSKTKEINHIKEFINGVKKNFSIKKQNKLGESTCYFNMITIPVANDNYGNKNYMMARKDILFSMNYFYTNKTLDNIFGEAIDSIKKRVRFFINNEDWYRQKGIPYTLGILLSGIPGAGKTSLIKAIANETRRHIFNLELSDNVTKTQLNNLFYKEDISVESKMMGGNSETFTIPNNQRIYVFEDIDCMSEIVYRRKEVLPIKSDTSTESTPLDEMFGCEFSKPAVKKNPNNPNIKENLDLSFLLNLIDGVLETPGRIMIITSNHPEKLDPAFIRPGRIDINAKFENCSSKTVCQMINHIYDQDMDEKTICDRTKTPAEVNNILFKNFDDPQEGISQLMA
jgi:predicted transcriptional regulator